MDQTPTTAQAVPSPTFEDMQRANRVINSSIRGWRSGAERLEIARASRYPALREAAATYDAYWARAGQDNTGAASPAPSPVPVTHAGGAR